MVIRAFSSSSAVVSKFTWGLDLSGQNGNNLGGTGVSPVSCLPGLHAAGGVGGLLAMHDCNATATSSDDHAYIYFYDANGNVCQLVDATLDDTWDDTDYGDTVAKYEYYPFGGQLRHAGPAAGINPFQFSTKYRDQESALYYYSRRYHKPRHGRWISRDPIGEKGSLLLYSFVENSPIHRIDPMGLYSTFRMSRDRDRARSDYTERDQTQHSHCGKRNNSVGTGSLNSDWAGRALLHWYLWGGGTTRYILNDADWTTYMRGDEWMRQDLSLRLSGFAATLCQSNEQTIRVDMTFPMELDNGEGMVGYQYLHGTNKHVGDFRVHGSATKRLCGVDKQGNCCCCIDFNLYYQWNDILDPNPEYDSDTVKSAFAEAATMGQAEPYIIHISWNAQSTYNSCDRDCLGSGWPFRADSEK